MRACAVLLVVLACGCARLNFLKPPSVPRPAGASRTEGASAVTTATLGHADPDADWSGYNNTLAGTRFSPLNQITSRNAGGLRQVCAFDLHERASMQSAPVVIGGVLFVTTPKNTYAIDAATCALRWKHTYDYSPSPPFDLKVNRGVAYLDGRLFRGANDGRVYALDAATGEELWNVVAGDPAKGETFPAAPAAWGGLVFIGNAGGDNFGVSGRMMAFDARTGGRVWSTSLVAEQGEAGRTWPPETEIFPGAARHRGPHTRWTPRPGSCTSPPATPLPISSPRFVRDKTFMRIRWWRSTLVPASSSGPIRSSSATIHDWDVAAAPALVTTRKARVLLAVGGKDGHLYGVDRRSAAHVYATPVTTIENIEAPLTPRAHASAPA